MAEISPLDGKALVTIAILATRRESWSVITYEDLEARTGHPRQWLGQVLERVGAWCFHNGKQSLAMLVIRDADGKPGDGMFAKFRGDTDPVTTENYEKRRLQLWREDWSGTKLPVSLDQVAAAYAEVGTASY